MQNVKCFIEKDKSINGNYWIYEKPSKELVKNPLTMHPKSMKNQSGSLPKRHSKNQ